MTSLDERLVCNPNVTFQRLGDELVIVNLETDTIYTLNATAAKVWESLQNGADMEEVRSQLLADYNVEDTTLDRELSEAFAKLKDFGLIAKRSTPA